MTVRAWFTISAMVLVALTIAVTVRLLSPAPIPEIIARSGDVRLVGHMERACWPARGEELRCETHTVTDPEARAVPARGDLRVVVAFPAPPEDGSIRIFDPVAEELVVEHEEWLQEIPYDLGPGLYQLTAEARYPRNAFVTYTFRFRVTTSGP